jgi:hypothetical protein
MSKTLNEKFAEALTFRGEVEVHDQKTSKYRVFTRRSGGFYYLGKSGALRFGKNSTSSIPVSDKGKELILAHLA